MIKTKKIGNRIEYTETVIYSCGHRNDIVTLGYKMTRKQANMKRENICPSCQLRIILDQAATDGSHTKRTNNVT